MVKFQRIFVINSKDMYKFLLFLGFLSAIGCGGVPASAQSSLLSPDDFEKMLQGDKSVQLVDVRTAGEYRDGHIEAALNRDYYADDFAAQLSKLDKNKPVMVYCAAGSRSSSAAEQLKKMGFKNVYDLDGGMTAWRESGKKVVK